MALIWTGSASASPASLSFFLNTTVFAMAGASGARKALAAFVRARMAMARRIVARLLFLL